MKLVVGFGNPEARYDNTRHNVGFRVVDAFADEWGVTFVDKPKFQARIGELTVGNSKALLVKPYTYYNDIGKCVQAMSAFYKVNTSEILLIHDELAMPVGVLRTRIGGSDAGNNGIKSVERHLGTEATVRLRIGVKNEQCERIDTRDFVLGKFSTSEREVLANFVLPRSAAIIANFIQGKFETTTLRQPEA